MDIYIVSLIDSVCRRAEIGNRLDSFKLSYRFIDAVDGRKLAAAEYFQKMLNENYWFNRRAFISPSELGCKLSHEKALNEFLSTEQNLCIVLEDDAILDHRFVELLEFINNLDIKDDFILHLGGQDGLPSSRRVLKTKNKKFEGIFSVNKLTLRWLYRTVGYVISRESALKIIDVHSKNNFVVDDWGFILRKANIKNIYFKNVISHPIDLSDSAIQKERNTKNYD
ncbi:glycosyltransferase family 25 protein [Vibrio cholerae]|nr:glycosyltransferase family 25 protein [Vibrio cholerae]